MGDVIVVDNSWRPLGLVTECHLVVRVIVDEPGDLHRLAARDLLDGAPVAAAPRKSTLTVRARLMKHGLRRIPIVRSDGTFDGIVSASDRIAAAAAFVSDLASLVEQRPPRV